MAGLAPAISVFHAVASLRRGCPRSGAGMTARLGGNNGRTRSGREGRKRRGGAAAPALSDRRGFAQPGAGQGAAVRLRFRRWRRQRGILRRPQYRGVPVDRAIAALLYRGQGGDRDRIVRPQIRGPDRRRADGLGRADVAGGGKAVRGRGAAPAHPLCAGDARQCLDRRDRRDRAGRVLVSALPLSLQRPRHHLRPGAPRRRGRRACAGADGRTRPASRSARAISGTAAASRSPSTRGPPIRC